MDSSSGENSRPLDHFSIVTLIFFVIVFVNHSSLVLISSQSSSSSKPYLFRFPLCAFPKTHRDILRRLSLLTSPLLRSVLFLFSKQHNVFPGGLSAMVSPADPPASSHLTS